MKVKKFEFNPFPVNTYLVFDETGEAALIDAGMFTEQEEQELEEYLKKNNLTIKVLLNTHLHLDHCFGNAYMKRIHNLSTHASQQDSFLLEGMQAQAARFGLRLNAEPPAIGTVIKEGNIISFGNIRLKALHVPGHSPGSIVFYSEDKGVLFSGDVLFQDSIGRTDLPGGDYDVLISGIRNKLLTLPEETVVFPGHGPRTTIGEEKRNNSFLN